MQTNMQGDALTYLKRALEQTMAMPDKRKCYIKLALWLSVHISLLKVHMHSAPSLLQVGSGAHAKKGAHALKQGITDKEFIKQNFN